MCPHVFISQKKVHEKNAYLIYTFYGYTHVIEAGNDKKKVHVKMGRDLLQCQRKGTDRIHAICHVKGLLELYVRYMDWKKDLLPCQRKRRDRICCYMSPKRSPTAQR